MFSTPNTLVLGGQVWPKLRTQPERAEVHPRPRQGVQPRRRPRADADAVPRGDPRRWSRVIVGRAKVLSNRGKRHRLARRAPLGQSRRRSSAWSRNEPAHTRTFGYARTRFRQDELLTRSSRTACRAPPAAVRQGDHDGRRSSCWAPARPRTPRATFHHGDLVSDGDPRRRLRSARRRAPRGPRELKRRRAPSRLRPLTARRLRCRTRRPARAGRSPRAVGVGRTCSRRACASTAWRTSAAPKAPSTRRTRPL